MWGRRLIAHANPHAGHSHPIPDGDTRADKRADANWNTPTDCCANADTNAHGTTPEAR